MLTETPEIIVDTCANCGNEIFKGDDVLQFPSTEHYFCDSVCVYQKMIEEDNLRRVVAE